MRDRAQTVLLLVESFVLLLFPLRHWIRASPREPLAAPATPLDRTDGVAARQWLFLRQARTTVPPGETYTVVAPTRDVEMNLFMMSLGLLPEARGLPSSYYEVPTPEIGSQARYVLAYENAPASGRVRLRAVFAEGQVYERQAAQN
jgi:hypothetical protein